MKEIEAVLRTLREERKGLDMRGKDLDRKITVLESLFEKAPAPPKRERVTYSRRHNRITPGDVIRNAVLKVARNGGNGLASVVAVTKQLRTQGYTDRRYSASSGGLRTRVASEMCRMGKAGLLNHAAYGVWEVPKGV